MSAHKRGNPEFRFVEVPDDQDGVYMPTFQVWKGHNILFQWSCITGLRDFTTRNTSMPLRVREMLKTLTEAEGTWFNEALNGNHFYPGDLIDHEFGIEWKPI